MGWKEKLAMAVAAGDPKAQKAVRAIKASDRDLDARLSRLEGRSSGSHGGRSTRVTDAHDDIEIVFARPFAEIEKAAIAGESAALQTLRDQANSEDSPDAPRARAALSKMREPLSDRMAKDPNARHALGYRVLPQPTRGNVHAIPLMTPSEARAFRQKKGFAQ